MRKFGLIGFPLTHSFSPNYFAKKFVAENIGDATYSAYEIDDLSDLHYLIETEGLDGFNVTIPHKQNIVPYLDLLNYQAAQINAVNCVRVTEGKLIGFNTDYIAFKISIAKLAKSGQKALIFGNGGSSVAIKFALHELGISYKTVSRKVNAELNYTSLDEATINEFEILINTTPLGTFPNIETCIDIPYEGIGPNHVCHDLVYNPSESLFLQKAKKQGATTKNGFEMLEIQADRSWDIWNS